MHSREMPRKHPSGNANICGSKARFLWSHQIYYSNKSRIENTTMAPWHKKKTAQGNVSIIDGGGVEVWND